ncbi:MAG TPA: IclR family transcriptional regulator [Solirubrobacteraceae bacterium]|nr:IclR family transcriptional regulator [Solirubrobacteraceae bacterium]
MKKPLDPENPGRFSSSLCAGLAMLSCFTPEHPVRGIADMAEALNLGRSTTHRYATTLVTLGYLEQGPSRKYRLAARVSDFGLAMLDSLAIRDVARERLRELRAQTGRTVALAILDGAEVTYIDRWQGSRRGQYAIDLGVGVGTRLPAHSSAAGKALLACLPAAEQRELISDLRLSKRAPRSITTKAALRAELERIAATHGALAVEDEELLAGRRAIAAPIFDGDGYPIAAIELAAPTDAFTREQLVQRIGPQVFAAARRVTAELTAEPVED